MNGQEIIKLARDVSNTPHDATSTPDLFGENQIVRFAQLVAAAEREACAKVCESHKSENFPLIHNNAVVGCAFAIRARGQQ